jgi:tetratricopeptide (TPR) repeat protein
MHFFEKALRLSKLCGVTNEQCNALIGIARLKLRTGDYSTVMMHVNEAQRLSKLSANLYEEARALWIEALCSTQLGAYQNSIIQFKRARDILGLCGLSGSSFDYTMRKGQAEVHLLKSEYAEARSIYTQIVKTTSADQNAHAYAFALLNIAQIDVMIDGTEQDINNNLNNARTMFNNLKYPTEICDMVLADLHLRKSNTSSASTLFLKSLHLSWGMDTEITSYCLERLADESQWGGDNSVQSHWPMVYLGFAQRSKQKLALHKALLLLGDVFISDKDEETAYNLYDVALEGFTYMDVHCSCAQSMLRLGDLAHKRGDISKATEFWKAARPLFEQSLQAKEVDQINARVATVEETD